MTKTRLIASRSPVTARLPRIMLTAALCGFLAGCGGGDMSPEPGSDPRASTVGKGRDNPDAPSIFGRDGLSLGNGVVSSDSGLFGGEEGEGRLPVNRHLWQASLDTLSFLPLASSDPFTGVIATEWGTNPSAPDERYKVSAFITSAALSAASLKVAVYREVKGEDGQWLPAPVSADTVRKLEDAILTRAREIRIAEREGRAAG